MDEAGECVPIYFLILEWRRMLYPGIFASNEEKREMEISKVNG